MYSFFVNQTKINLLDQSDVEGIKSKDNVLKIRYPGKSKFILNIIDRAEKNNSPHEVFLFSENLERLKVDFFSIVKKDYAAGGLVFNDSDKLLVIFRRNFWDLPKGKKEFGESKKQTAIREVTEETGVTMLTITKKVGKTRHIFRSKSGRRILKISHWYEMKTRDQKLIPQAEEDIEQAVWVDPKIFFTTEVKVYPSIREMLVKAHFITP